MEKWNGFDCENFEFEGNPATIVFPEEGTATGGLVLKTEYQHHFPEAAEIPLLKLGYHVCFVENDNRFGQPEDLDRKARFVRFVQQTYGLREKCVPVGFSCGGMIGIYFAERYPELVSCLYIDAPVVNFMSWPCDFGRSSEKPYLDEILPALRLKSLAELLAYRAMPLDKIPSLVEKKIPLVMASGDSDTAVPYHENGIFVERAYKDAGLPIEVYIKPGGNHHPHGIPDPQPIVDFILKHDK
jgi:pimeloyl-ACP methyl ester carboxylesterase